MGHIGQMEISQDKMTGYLRAAAALPLRRLVHAEGKSAIIGFIHSRARFLMPLEGEMPIRYAFGGRDCGEVIRPGEVLLCPPLVSAREYWTMPHSMISVVFHEGFIRTLYIKHNGVGAPPNGPDIYYHTSKPLNPMGHHLLQALLAAEPDSEAARICFELLLKTVAEAVATDTGSSGGKEDFTWQQVCDYIEANFQRDISREDIAAAMRIHPVYLSRLVRKRAGCGVNEYLTRLQMEYAVFLLADPLLSIGEIAHGCGYATANYFIRVFRRHYLETPARYRRKLFAVAGRV